MSGLDNGDSQLAAYSQNNGDYPPVYDESGTPILERLSDQFQQQDDHALSFTPTLSG